MSEAQKRLVALVMQDFWPLNFLQDEKKTKRLKSHLEMNDKTAGLWLDNDKPPLFSPERWKEKNRSSY